MPELDEERYVRALFADLYAVQLVKVPESQDKTFDFELVSASERSAALEVKRFDRTPRTPANGWRRIEEDIVLDGKTVGKQVQTWRDVDNAPNRVGNMIHEAHTQLSTASGPKVRVFVNDEHVMDVGDLDEAVNGYLIYGDETTGRYKNLSSIKVAQGRIRDEKLNIDLYVWIDRHREHTRTLWIAPHTDGRPRDPEDESRRGPFFRFTSDAGYDLARRHFRIPETPRPETDPDADVPTLREMLLREAGITRPK